MRGTQAQERKEEAEREQTGERPLCP